MNNIFDFRLTSLPKEYEYCVYQSGLWYTGTHTFTPWRIEKLAVFIFSDVYQTREYLE